ALLDRLGRLTDLGLVLERPLGLLVLDVDRLRAVNEGRGLPAGDALLRDVGRQLVRQFCRRDDFVARLDGGSFAVLMRAARRAGPVGGRPSDAGVARLASAMRATVRACTEEPMSQPIGARASTQRGCTLMEIFILLVLLSLIMSGIGSVACCQVARAQRTE